LDSVGGTVDFTNKTRGQVLVVDEPFFDDLGNLLEGPGFVAQLYVWQGVAGFLPIAEPVPFSTNGYFFGGVVRIPPDPWWSSPAWVQVRAWAVSDGMSFEDATMAGAWSGASRELYLPTTGTLLGAKPQGPPLIPVRLIGLEYPGPPVIVRQPGSEVILAGQSATLSVVASRGVGVTYQWCSDPGERPDGLIVNATNVTYTTPALGTNTTYWVTIANVAGAVTSKRATVTVLSQPPQLALQVVGGWPTLTLTGDPGVAYRVERAPAAAGPWVAVVEVTLARSPFTFVDPPGVGTDQRFYRAVAR
jgi:hypothetical protein